MKSISVLILVLAAGAGSALSASAAEVGRQYLASATAPTAAAAKADGEIRRVDKSAGTVVITHGPIANLDMPAMTMPYRVRDRAMLDRIKPGDRIKFEAANVGGVFTLMSFDKVK
jgi:Cu(I)/Ag(I) efflux system periplasmic protein CusF